MGWGWLGWTLPIAQRDTKNSCPLKYFQQTMYSALMGLTLVLGLAGLDFTNVKKQKPLHRDDVDQVDCWGQTWGWGRLGF